MIIIREDDSTILRHVETYKLIIEKKLSDNRNKIRCTHNLKACASNE